MATILNDDCSNLTEWTDSDTGSGVSSQVTFDGRTTFKFDTGASAASIAVRQRTISAAIFPYDISLTVYFDSIGTTNSDAFRMLYNGASSDLFVVCWRSNGLYFSDSEVLVGNWVVQDIWQAWKFSIKSVGGSGIIVDVYLDGVLKVSDLAVTIPPDGSPGLLEVAQYGATANMRTYMDLLLITDSSIYPRITMIR